MGRTAPEPRVQALMCRYNKRRFDQIMIALAETHAVCNTYAAKMLQTTEYLEAFAQDQATTFSDATMAVFSNVRSTFGDLQYPEMAALDKIKGDADLIVNESPKFNKASTSERKVLLKILFDTSQRILQNLITYLALTCAYQNNPELENSCLSALEEDGMSQRYGPTRLPYSANQYSGGGDGVFY